LAIDLPPVITPQQAPASELVAHYHGGIAIPFHGRTITVFGPAIERGVVSPGRLKSDVAQAGTFSEAVRLIGYLYHISGYPAAVTRYAMVDSSHLYVYVAPGRVSEIRSPPQYHPYLDSLIGPQVLEEAKLERARALADVLSQREGVHYKATFIPTGDDSVTLDFSPSAPGASRTALRAGFSNYGNRYSGPYLADIGLRQTLPTGDEFVLSGITSVRMLDLGGSESEPYHEGDLEWSRITPLGLLSLDGRYADFATDSQGFHFGGNLATGSASWLYPFYATLRQRLNVLSKLERSHESIHAEEQTSLGPNPEVLSDLYNSAELGVTYTWRAANAGREREFSIDVSGRKGFSGRPAGDPSNPGYLIWRTGAEGTYGLLDSLNLKMSFKAQLGGSSVPQLEQFVIGGPATDHAYDAGAGAGDRGWNLRAGTEWKGAAESWSERHTVRPRLFVEYGSATRGGPGQGTVTIADVGVESDIRFSSWLSGTISAAQSIHEEGRQYSPNGLHRNCVFFRLVAQY
jgi:hemolysin activation/secretion protein